ncbi:subtype A tannase [Streptococcus sp. sy018]|uniref:subtype A tannase n=1 Tax=Streptococcus sp. sy018 TaxID=2600147 RepID=UPI0021BD6A2C|nr:subtype A tannase [Streptococcus sp. sy018]
MKKHTIISGTILLAAGLLLTACSNQSSTQKTDNKQTTTVSQLSSGEVKTTLAKIDQSKWLYNAEDNVYYQLGIPYAATPVNSQEQTLSIFIPGDYLTTTDNGDGTYTAKLNSDTKINQYTIKTAPIVMPINTPGYSAMSALTDYTSDAKTYTDQGFVYVSAGLRGRDSGAPLGVTDAKAAIRYLRYSADTLAGNTDNIFVYGMSEGGAQSAIIGASGDSALYDPYLKAIGAVEGVSDSVAGTMAWCPITNLDSANEAYEWNMGSTRTDLDSESQQLSDDLATAFADYINQLGLTNGDTNLTLDSSKTGIYQAGTYYDYIKETIEQSLNTFLATTTFPYDASSSAQNSGMGMPSGQAPSGEAPSGEAPSDLPSEMTTTQTSESSAIETIDNIQRTQTSSSTLSLTGTYNTAQDYIEALNSETNWVTYDEKTNTATISSIADFAKYLKSASKSVGAFDALDASQGENQLFGSNGTSVHWDATMAKLLKDTDYATSYSDDLKKTDELGTDLTTRLNMYTPLYYLLDSYDGKGTANVARFWRIRSGINQGDTALTTEINLALALKQYGIDSVDFATVWGQAHTQAEISGNSSDNFISWVNESLAQ